MGTSTIIKKLSVDEWSRITDNPRQRDTIARAAKAKRSHLAKSSPTQWVVHAAMIGGELRYKLDGHTRAYLWKSGELELPPGKLTCIVHCVDNAAEAMDLYTHYDSSLATESAKDKLAGACRENGITIASPALQPMAFAVALRHAAGTGSLRQQKKTEYELVREWKDELVTLDSFMLSRVNGPLLAFCLITLRVFPQTATQLCEFMTRYCNDAGVKDENGKDGVQALTEHMMMRRANRTLTGWDNLLDIAERAYYCFDAYLRDRKIGPVLKKSLDDAIKKANERAAT